MKNNFKLGMLCFLLLSAGQAFSQTSVPESMDMMRSNGKIYVVVAVVLTILIGMVLYLVNLDRKIARMEKGN